MRGVAMRASGSTTDFGWLPPALVQFHSEPELVRQVLNTEKTLFEKKAEPTPTEASFGRFRLLPTHFLLLEGDEPVPLGSRALEILIVLVERAGELVSKQELMDRVWPNVFVGPANLTVHISALRRTLHDGRGGNRFIINIPGRGYKFVASVTATRLEKTPLAIVSRRAPELEGHLKTNLLSPSRRALELAWDEKRWAQLRAELDAFYARAYGLTRDDLSPAAGAIAQDRHTVRVRPAATQLFEIGR
jgi:DNA-binding winged helix-turn-helix (wHTH) protein